MDYELKGSNSTLLKAALSELNTEQKEAVFSDHNRILVLAGAGTGKTKTMVSRVARLIDEGVDPGSLLLLTFTRAAAMEAKERVIAMVGEKGKEIYCSTFHAWAVKVLRQYAFKIGYTPTFTIYDDEDRMDVIADVIEDLQYTIKPQDVLDAMEKHAVYNIPYNDHEIANIVKEYDFRLRRCNAIDMNGLLFCMQRILKNEMIQELLNHQWTHVFVDEMQDTDRRQMNILETINPDHLFVVGDDFQSIYKFRGADVSIIMDMAKNPGFHVVKLEENYRSTHQIVNAANRLIKHNNQTEKVLKAHRNGADNVFCVAEDILAECRIIGKIIQEEKTEYKNIAVLGRTNRQIAVIAEELQEDGIPCKIKTAASDVLTSADAKKLFAWMRVMQNPTDDVSVASVLNWPEQIVSKKDLLKAEMFLLEKNCSLYTALVSLQKGDKFFTTYKSIEGLIASEYDADEPVAALDMLDYILESTEIKKHYLELDLQNRIKAIQQIGYAVATWQEAKAAIGENYSAKEWLDYYAMRTMEGVRIEDEEADEVQIMTAHGSKGLEFDVVIIAGCNQGTFPMTRGGNIEEERRLFFVAMTRAKNRLYFTRPAERDFYNFHTNRLEPSIFLAECDE